MSRFGDKVKVLHEGFMIGDDLHIAYYPKFEVDGKFVYIKDENFKTDKINAASRYQAKILGIEFLNKVKGKEKSHED